MSDSGQLDGRVAVITGAASGMGLATAERFVAEGARVVIADYNAVVNLSVTTALELAPNSIRVNAICPGVIFTPLMHSGDVDDAEAMIGRLKNTRNVHRMVGMAHGTTGQPAEAQRL